MDKRIFVFIGVLVALAFIAGRYSAPEKIKIETKTEIKREVIKDEHKAIDTRQSVVETTKPDGTKVKRTETRTAERDDSKALNELIEAQTKTSETKTRAGVIVSFTASKQVTNLFAPPVFGSQVVFPLVLGVYGGASLQLNGTVGISLGMEF